MTDNPAEPAAVRTAGDLPEPDDAAVAAPKKQHSFARELPFLLLLALVLALLIKAFLIQAFYIPSGSMENTLQIRDRVLVNKLVYRFRDVHRGEIVVFDGDNNFTQEVICPPPANGFDRARRKVASAFGLGTCEKDFIKRVIGVAGDTVQCCDGDGRVTVNGVAIDEGSYVFEPDRQEFGPVTVPEDKLWVMGDHRSASSDSRAHGVIPTDMVIGRAFVVIWPPGHAKGLKVPKALESSALAAPPWSVAATPPFLGLVLATPVTLLRRRRRLRRAA